MSEIPSTIREPRDMVLLLGVAESWSPEYSGYALCGMEISHALDAAVRAYYMPDGEGSVDVSLPLPLQPPNPKSDGYKIHEKNTISDEIRDFFYNVTHADIISDTRTSKDPYGKVVLRGRHSLSFVPQGEEDEVRLVNKTVYFIETYAKGSQDFMRWEVATTAPDEALLLSPNESLPFETTEMKARRERETELALKIAEMELQFATLEEPAEANDQRRAA